jgi:SAM-dependent methyltransferase
MGRLLRKLLRPISNSIVSASSNLRDKIRFSSLSDPGQAAKFFPYAPQESSFATIRSPQRPATLERDPLKLPVPPKSLWLGYADSPEQFLESGRTSYEHILRSVAPAGLNLNDGGRHRVLDFGCGAGRTLRWFAPISDRVECWGVDMLDEWVIWCQQHLSPPMKFATNTSFPHLPFEDNSFDLIYNESVFTHIADLADMWLLELRRILRPGGVLFAALHDNDTIKSCFDPKRAELQYLTRMLRELDAKQPFLQKKYERVVINRVPGPGSDGQAQVFYDADYLREQWGQFLEFVSLAPNPYGKLSALVMKKRSAS